MLAALLLAAVAAAPAPASTPPSCAAAAALPADADADARRIACTIPEKYRFDVAVAERLGAELRAHDVAAWLTTDALREMGAVGKPLPQGWEGQGWTTTRTDAGIRVDYAARVQGADVAYASAVLRLEPWGVTDARAEQPPLPLDARQRRLVRARELAVSHGSAFFCTKHAANMVAFEWDDHAGPQILVFLMSAWVEDAPLGGFHMYRIDRDATRVIDHFSQTKGCLLASPKELASTEAQVVSHLNSAAPTLFHVFMSLQYRKPLYVVTTQNGLLWKVADGRISLIERPSDAPTPHSAAGSPAA